VCQESFRLLSELKNHYPIHYLKGQNESDFLKDGVPIMEEQDESEDSKTLITFDKHLDKSVISQIVVNDISTIDNYDKVQTKTEPKEIVLTEDMTNAGGSIKVYVVDVEFTDNTFKPV
jgi:hypothetical protein